MKRFFYILIGLLVLITVIATLLPTLISSSWGKSQLIKIANSKIPGTIEVDQLSISWFGPQVIQHAQLHDPHGNLVGNFDKLQSDASLLSLLFSGDTRQNLKLENLNLYLSELGGGLTNLHQSLKKIAVLQPNYPPLQLKLLNVQAFASITSKKDPIHIHLAGESEEGIVKGNFSIDILLDPVPLDHKILFTPRHLEANISHFPVAIIDHLASLNDPKVSGVIKGILGDTLDLTLQHQSPDLKSIDEGSTFQLQANTASSSLTLEGLFFDNHIQLATPATAKITLTPESFELIKNYDPEKIGFQLANTTHLNIELTQLDLPIRQEKAKNSGKNYFEAIVGATSVALTQVPILENLKVEQLAGSIKGTLLGQFEAILSARISSDHPDFQMLMSPAVQIHSKIHGQMRSFEKWQFDSIQTQLASDLLKAQFEGSIFDFEQLKVTKPIMISYQLTPAALQRLGLASDSFSIKTIPLQLTIFPFQTLFEEIFDSQINGTFNLPSLQIDFTNGQAAHIRQLEIPFLISPIENEFSATFSAQIDQNGISNSPLSGSINLVRWLDENHKLDLEELLASIDLQLKDFPIAFLSALKDKNRIEDLLGDKISLTLNGQFLAKDGTGHVVVHFSADQFESTLKAYLKDNTIFNESGKPVTLSYKLTPARFLAWQNLIRDPSDDPIKLNQATSVKASISTFQIPLDLNLSQIKLNADLLIDQLVLQKGQNPPLYFEKINSFIQSQHLAEAVHFKVQMAEKIKQQSYPFVFVGSVQHLLKDTGKIDTDALSVNIDANIPRFPASLICQLGGIDCSIRQKIEALLGETIDTEIRIKLHKMDGPLFAKLEGANGKVTLDAQITQGNMSLNKPFEAEFQVTPALGRSIVQDIIPIFKGVVSADHKIKIKIDPLDFHFPLKQIELDKIVIGKGTIELGKLYFNGEGTLGSIFDLFGRSNMDELSVRFTPLYFKMERGTVKLSRMDMLLMKQYPIAIWGKVNPVKDKVDIRIGLTAAALSQAFRISGLSENYLMQLPLTGTLSNASIDKTKALAKISALVAQSQGTPQATLLGTFLGIASGELTEEPAPEPTTTPLPWDLKVKSAEKPAPPKEKESNKAEKKDKEGKTDKKKRKEGVIEEVEKAASSLIESLFGYRC